MTTFQAENVEIVQSKAQPLVSIVIDNYNYGQFLGQAIDSVLGQSYRNFELIVVDDGSTDHSRDIIESYGDRIISIFQKNAGQGAAFNAGIERSKGEIICILDADDYFHKDKLAKTVEAFQAHPEWIQISHQCASVDEFGAALDRASITVFDQGDVRNLILKFGKYKWMRTSGRAYRRDGLLKVLPIASGRVDSADAYLLVTVPFYGQVGSIEDVLMYYRVHGKNRHAGTSDLEHLLRGRQLIHSYVNNLAEQLKLPDRLDLRKDADYRTFKAMEQAGGSWFEALQISWLALLECFALKRTLKETATRLLWGGICIISPTQGKLVLQHGLQKYLRCQLLRQEFKT